jgi:hypothetical protein
MKSPPVSANNKQPSHRVQQQQTSAAAHAAESETKEDGIRRHEQECNQLMLLLDYRLEPELLFSGEESALLRLLQTYHSIGVRSSCRTGVYQVGGISVFHLKGQSHGKVCEIMT